MEYSEYGFGVALMEIEARHRPACEPRTFHPRHISTTFREIGTEHVNGRELIVGINAFGEMRWFELKHIVFIA